jgi:predicted 2-oxoglutarate/Fe(II)-dependent dioxygenase YbiX
MTKLSTTLHKVTKVTRVVSVRVAPGTLQAVIDDTRQAMMRDDPTIDEVIFHDEPIPDKPVW